MVTVKADVHRIDVKTDNLGDQLRLVAEGHGVLLAEIGRLREDCVAWARESHQFMLFVHKDLREHRRASRRHRCDRLIAAARIRDAARSAPGAHRRCPRGGVCYIPATWVIH